MECKYFHMRRYFCSRCSRCTVLPPPTTTSIPTTTSTPSTTTQKVNRKGLVPTDFDHFKFTTSPQTTSATTTTPPKITRNFTEGAIIPVKIKLDKKNTIRDTRYGVIAVDIEQMGQYANSSYIDRQGFPDNFLKSLSHFEKQSLS